MQTNEERLRSYAETVNSALRERLTLPLPQGDSTVREAMCYSLLDAGKRLRAALTLEFARISGGGRAGALELACAIEMIHAYSLIHDDLPCMDNDDFRRGKPSCHKKFGEATALLAGDALLTLAFRTAAEAELSDAQRAEAVALLARAAGIGGMIGGQELDLLGEGKKLTEKELQTLCAMKTGALLTAAAELGCVAGGADEPTRRLAREFTGCYGLAFQMTDDILDVIGDAAKLGKSIGSDKMNQKTTYVTLLGVSGAREAARGQLLAAQAAARSLADGGFLVWLAESLLYRDH